jgi:hypothetical protein
MKISSVMKLKGIQYSEITDLFDDYGFKTFLMAIKTSIRA